MKKNIIIILLITLVALTCGALIYLNKEKISSKIVKVEEKVTETRSFSDNFSGQKTIEETGGMEETGDSFWWVNSGAYVYYRDGIMSSVKGDLNKSSKWYKEYLASNPADTDNGLHPQNILRVVLRSRWANFNQQCFFRINNYNLSSSENRNQSNGILLFNRYIDGDNLYYTGLRVDGYAVIKKKYKGSYYTLATVKVIDEKYDRVKKPNLIPTEKWIGVKSVVSDFEENKVKIELFIDQTGTGQWTKAAEAVDDGVQFGGSAILDEGYAGMRTDFMDVDFRDYSISELS